MRKKYFILATAMTLFFAGCGSSGKQESSAVQSYNGYYGYSDTAMATEDAFEYEEEMDSGNTEIDPALSSEKLVYTGSLEVQTLNYDECVVHTRDLIKEFGGIIQDESEYDRDYNWYNSVDSSGTRYYNFTVRIPTEHFDEFMNSLDGDGKVISRHANVTNITKQYYDNSARIEALEIQEKRLLEMMEKAETIEDMIAVESRLSDVQYDLNSYRNYQSSMDTDVMYSTIYVEIDEVKQYTDTRPNFFGQLGDSFVKGWKGFVYFAESVLIFLVYAIPYILVIGLILYVLKKKNLLKRPHFRKKNKTKVTEEIIHNDQE